MRNMTRRHLIGTAAGLTLVLSAGAVQAAGETIALVTINQQALFFNQINDGAQSAADKNGVKLVIFNANNKPDAQNTAIEDYITQKVDGIVLVAIDVNGVKPAITDAKNAGIPVVAIDARIPDGDNAAFIGVDNEGAGGRHRQVLCRLREIEHGRLRQDRRHRRAQFVHPEPAARRLQEGGPAIPAPTSPFLIRSTDRTCRTSR